MVRKELLDELDRRILSELQRNARASNRAVARAVGVSPPTVAQRIRRMENVGLIRGYRVDVAMSEVRAPNVEPGIKCAECRGPIHGPPRMRRFNERSFAFCCPMCEGTFEDRMNRLKSGTKGIGIAALLLGWMATFGVVGAGCLGMAGCMGPPSGLTPTANFCPPGVRGRDDFEGIGLTTPTLERSFFGGPGWRRAFASPPVQAKGPASRRP